MDTSQLDHYLENRIKTFDLIGFRGTECVSKLIIHLERKAIKNKNIHISPKISHIGLAIEGKHLHIHKDLLSKPLSDAIDQNKVYIFESTASGRILDNVPDVWGKFFFGAQLRDLKSVINKYSGKIYHSPKLFQTDDKQVNRLIEFVDDYNHRPYEKSLRSLFGNIFRCIETFENTETVFCSELVTLALQRCEILEEYVNPEYVVPLDFYHDPSNPNITLDVDKEIPLIYDWPVELC